MKASAKPADVKDILCWRDLYRHEMNCQIVHDSIHARSGWTDTYFLQADSTTVGYGLIAVAGPWRDKSTVFEFYVLPDHRGHLFDLFEALLFASRPVAIEVQTNDPLLTVMLHVYCTDFECEKILFHDRRTTHLPSQGAIVRHATAEDADRINAQKLDADAGWLLELDGTIAATGGILFHYNRPYGDIYMAVAEQFRRRGLGSYLVQELKRIAYEGGNIPAARCNPTNIASRNTLLKAGFDPCGNILVGRVRHEKQ